MVPALAAVAGVVVAHTVDYVVVFPQSDQRAAALQASGHAYWPVAVGAAAAAGTVAVLLAAGRGVRRAWPGRAASVGATALAATRLLAWQLLAFTAMEAGERAMVGLPPTVLLHSVAFGLGLALQVPVAWFATRLLDGVEQVTYRLVRARRIRPARGARTFPPPAGLLSPALRAAGAGALPRAPPVAGAA